MSQRMKGKPLGKDDGYWDHDDPFIYQVRKNDVPYTKGELRRHTIDWIATNIGVRTRHNRRAVVDADKRGGIHVTNHLLGNYAWYQIGRPYCKVGPNMADMMARTKINIPKNKVLMPFPAFAIRLPKSRDNPMTDGKGGPPLRAILVEGIFDFDEEQISVFRDHSFMNLILDFGDIVTTDENKYKYYHYFNIDMGTEGTVEDAFNQTLAEPRGPTGGYMPPEEFIRRILSLVVCTTFFMTNQHEQIMPDIPRRYVEQHRRLSNSRRPEDVRQLKDLMQRLKDMDHFGFMIREYELPRPIIHTNYADDQSGRGTGMQLEYSHMRGAHGAWRWIGPRSNPDLKWVFIQPTVVRPDLPFNPNRVVGYRVDDSVLD